MKFLASLVLFLSIVFADFSVNLGANVLIAKVIQNELYFGLDDGRLLKLKSANDAVNSEQILVLPKSQSYFDGEVNSKVVDVDKIGDKFILLVERDFMHKMLATYEKGEIKYFELPLSGIKRVYAADKNTAILLGMGSEILYFDLNSQKVIFGKKLTISPLGGVTFDKVRDLLVLTCEGGVIFYFDTKKREILKSKSVQKDNIFSVAIDGERVITGSNDKTCYYENSGKSKYIDAGFLVYSVALSPKLGAFSIENGVQILNLHGELTKKISYNGGILNYLYFWDGYLVGAGYDKIIYFWSYE